MTGAGPATGHQSRAVNVSMNDRAAEVQSVSDVRQRRIPVKINGRLGVIKIKRKCVQAITGLPGQFPMDFPQRIHKRLENGGPSAGYLVQRGLDGGLSMDSELA